VKIKILLELFSLAPVFFATAHFTAVIGGRPARFGEENLNLALRISFAFT